MPTIPEMADHRCPGTLVVHEDGTVLLCTEEAGGHGCGGDHLASRHPRAVTCRRAFAVSHCRRCAERRAALRTGCGDRAA
jgi:hypothetical protein